MKTKLVFRTNDSRPWTNVHMKCHDNVVMMSGSEAVHKQMSGLKAVY